MVTAFRAAHPSYATTAVLDTPHDDAARLVFHRRGRAVIIDNVDADPEWSRHPVPKQYGFQSYVSIPIMLADGRFYGTLCAIDPEPRVLSAATTVEVLEAFALRVAAIISNHVVKPKVV